MDKDIQTKQPINLIPIDLPDASTSKEALKSHSPCIKDKILFTMVEHNSGHLEITDLTTKTSVKVLQANIKHLIAGLQTYCQKS